MSREARGARLSSRLPEAKGLHLELRQVYASILEEHPGADLNRSGRIRPAVAAHDGQIRATGERPSRTRRLGLILAELYHTIAIQPRSPRRPEDTEISLTDVEAVRRRGRAAVDGVTKLSKFSTHSHEQQGKNIRKMLLAMARTSGSSYRLPTGSTTCAFWAACRSRSAAHASMMETHALRRAARSGR